MSDKTTRKKHPDRIWLETIKPVDVIGILEERASQVSTIIDSLDDQNRLPHTIGLFGTWGSGKTATVAYLADELEKRDYQIIYFNAYKYASYMEVVPALVYRLIDELPIGNDAAASERLLEIMATLSGKYAGRFGTWVESKIGVNPIELGKELLDVKELIESPQKKRKDLLTDYYTRVDRAQDTLVEVFDEANLKKPIVVLIDELDRCDPGEAFDAMKQLRILFNMRGLNIVFVLVANPQPIGLAIRHQFGLDASHDEYEPGRILEKFVDTYIDLAEPHSLCNYVTSLWERLLPGRLNTSSLIVALDARTKPSEEPTDQYGILKYGTALQRISTSNIFYSNLRTLEKTLAYCASRRSHERSLWTIWHLTMLKQANPTVWRDVVDAIRLLFICVKEAMVRLFELLHRQGQIDPDGRIKKSIAIAPDNNNSSKLPFDVYFNVFLDRAILESRTEHESSSTRALSRLASSDTVMNFVIAALMPSFGDIDSLRVNLGVQGIIEREKFDSAFGKAGEEAMREIRWIIGEF